MLVRCMCVVSDIARGYNLTSHFMALTFFQLFVLLQCSWALGVGVLYKLNKDNLMDRPKWDEVCKTSTLHKGLWQLRKASSRCGGLHEGTAQLFFQCQMVEPKDVHTGDMIKTEQFDLKICIWMCIYMHTCMCVWCVICIYLHALRISDKRSYEFGGDWRGGYGMV